MFDLKLQKDYLIATKKLLNSFASSFQFVRLTDMQLLLTIVVVVVVGSP